MEKRILNDGHEEVVCLGNASVSTVSRSGKGGLASTPFKVEAIFHVGSKMALVKNEKLGDKSCRIPLKRKSNIPMAFIFSHFENVLNISIPLCHPRRWRIPIQIQHPKVCL